MVTQNIKNSSTQLTGDGHPSDSVYNATPPAQSQDPHAVILKVPKPVSSTRDHLHLCVETLGDAVA
jgi:hypothetical protein